MCTIIPVFFQHTEYFVKRIVHVVGIYLQPISFIVLVVVLSLKLCHNIHKREI